MLPIQPHATSTASSPLTLSPPGHSRKGVARASAAPRYRRGCHRGPASAKRQKIPKQECADEADDVGGGKGSNTLLWYSCSRCPVTASTVVSGQVLVSVGWWDGRNDTWETKLYQMEIWRTFSELREIISIMVSEKHSSFLSWAWLCRKMKNVSGNDLYFTCRWRKDADEKGRR